MRISIITDAWEPQVNGVVRTLKQTLTELIAMGHEVDMITPNDFFTVPCPTYPTISLAVYPRLKLAKRLKAFAPDAMHIATEGPLGIAARNYAVRNKLPFSTAYHTRFPEYVKARINIPLHWTYRFLRWFHGPAMAVMAPTSVVKQDLEKYGIDNTVLWSRGVDLDVFKLPANGEPSDLSSLIPDSSPYPVFLYVGRVAVEKNIDAFLKLDLPGTKWVVGGGPGLSDMKKKYPDAKYFGELNKYELAKIYAAADVFVFPSKTDTFGLVLLEAMACGLPVAAYPVTGPIDVLGDSGAGVMHDDLREACLQALHIDRAIARAHAETFSWRAATEQFEYYLRPAPVDPNPLMATD